MSSLEVVKKDLKEVEVFSEKSDKDDNINTTTIAAQATPTGFGGVGIIRISGPKVLEIAIKILKFTPKPRYAYYTNFIDNNSDEVIDSGIAIYFKGPNSYTGEDVLELQGHGGPVVLNKMLSTLTYLGVDLANPGDFSKRAFLNGKLDLAQVEAVADLIHAQSWSAAKAAVRSLSGEFSKKINLMLDSLIKLRVYIESQLDFSEEEIDFIDNKKAQIDLNKLQKEVSNILLSAKQGVVLKEGINIVISGKPNAGKSSLLNLLSGEEVAIVTSIAGTTRDILKKNIIISGIPVNIIDTAGIRESDNLVEQEGIRRAKEEIKKAEEVLLVIDLDEFLQDIKFNLSTEEIYKNLKQRMFSSEIEDSNNLTIIFNKADIIDEQYGIDKLNNIVNVLNETAKSKLINIIFCSCRSKSNNVDIDKIKNYILKKAGFDKNNTEGSFIARTRHVNYLNKVSNNLILAKLNLEQNLGLELVAEELRLAQDNLSEITGIFTSDDLLGEIFSTFCIGK
tara:strand:- start:16844 stop:18364 length:1521 start_codon:yes stop_codon:yes gene_type:complete